MTPEPASPAPTRAPRHLWLWLAGLLLAFNAVAGTPTPQRLDSVGLRAAALTAPVPAHAQFRDPASLIKTAAQRALKAQDRPDGDPPLPLHHAAVVPPYSAAPLRAVTPRADAAPTRAPASRYRARAPPLTA
ncbi:MULTISPECIES: hypothetical protein [unclassified Sphingomonas]|uniref:hypothetical protein n=1 Tax=unclassified Sphingomonas TaxID=196159 RepID=UPI00083407E3|nr:MULTISPECIES: hypothetical protein [unclassified Sphingomonas]